MNRREKLLLIAFGVLVALLAGYQMVQRLVVAPLERKRSAIAAQQKRVREYEAELALLPPMVELWQELGRRTIDTDPARGLIRFQDEMMRLIRESGLGDSDFAVRNPRRQTDRRTGLTRLHLQLSMEGTLSEVVAWLRRFYELPFVARFESLTLTPSESRGGDRVLKVTARVSTTVLPETRLGGVVRPLILEDSGARLVRHRAEDAAYAILVDKEMFWRYVPPPPPPPPPPKREGKPPKRTEEPPPPRVPKINDPSVIVALLMYPGQHEIVTRRPGSNERKIYRIGDRIDDGELVMVHPYGAVIRLGDRAYLYPPNAALNREDQRVPLEEVPAVVQAMEALTRSSPGGDGQGEPTAPRRPGASPSAEGDGGASGEPAGPGKSQAPPAGEGEGQPGAGPAATQPAAAPAVQGKEGGLQSRTARQAVGRVASGAPQEGQP